MAIEQGDKISVEYTGKLESGEVFDSSTRGDHTHPIEFEVGAGNVIKGFDDAVRGMNEGEEKQITLTSEQAYGEPNPELKKDFPKSSLPAGQEPEVGMMLMLSTPQGQQMPSKIIAVDDEKITIDLNHPLAGKTLIFDIKIAKIEKK